MKKYSLGFLFDTSLTNVVLIQKTHPSWQAGKLNGVGGAINEGETGWQSQCREFLEETGVNHSHWYHAGILTLNNGGEEVQIYIYTSTADWGELDRIDSKTEEMVMLVALEELGRYGDRILPDVQRLLTLCQSVLRKKDYSFFSIHQKTRD